MTLGLDIRVAPDFDRLLLAAIRIVHRDPQAKMTWQVDARARSWALFIEPGPGRDIIQIMVQGPIDPKAQRVLDAPKGREELIAFIRTKAREIPTAKGRYVALMEDDDGSPSSEACSDEDAEGSSRS